MFVEIYALDSPGEELTTWRGRDGVIQEHDGKPLAVGADELFKEVYDRTEKSDVHRP